MTDINKIPDANIIAKRIVDTIPSIHELEMQLITKILNDWNEEWIDYIAENKTGLSDGTKRTNDKRLKDRIDRLGVVVNKGGVSILDNPGF
jgi:hypothetical protein